VRLKWHDFGRKTFISFAGVEFEFEINRRMCGLGVYIEGQKYSACWWCWS